MGPIRISGVAMALCLGMVALVGCKPDASKDGKAETVPATQAKALEVTEIQAGVADAAKDATMRPLYPKDDIEVTIRTAGKADGANLSVKLIALANGGVVGVQDVRLGASVASPQRVRFKPAPAWSTGRYLIEVTLDGKLAGHQELEIFPSEDPATG
ncbi:MAG: hypothetical protein ABN502_00630 [Gammaproteobacteria bacterium]